MCEPKLKPRLNLNCKPELGTKLYASPITSESETNGHHSKEKDKKSARLKPMVSLFVLEFYSKKMGKTSLLVLGFTAYRKKWTKNQIRKNLGCPSSLDFWKKGEVKIVNFSKT